MPAVPPTEPSWAGATQAQAGFLLVDDHALIREGMAMAIRNLRPQARLFEADSCAQAQALLHEHGHLIAVVLLDLDLTDTQGLETVQRVRLACQTQRIAVFTGTCDGQLALACIHHGAMCVIPKYADERGFLSGLQAVLDGRLHLPLDLLLMAGATEPGAGPAAYEPQPAPCPDSSVAAVPALPTLSPRQYEVLDLLLRGCTNPAIATALKISPDTAKMHVSAILRAHQVSTRTQLVLRYAAQATRPDDAAWPRR